MNFSVCVVDLLVAVAWSFFDDRTIRYVLWFYGWHHIWL